MMKKALFLMPLLLILLTGCVSIKTNENNLIPELWSKTIDDSFCIILNPGIRVNDTLYSDAYSIDFRDFPALEKIQIFRLVENHFDLIIEQSPPPSKKLTIISNDSEIKIKLILVDERR